MSTRGTPYCRVKVLEASAQAQVLKHGNERFDLPAANRLSYTYPPATALSPPLQYWEMETLNCFTTALEWQAANCVTTYGENATVYPQFNSQYLTDTQYNTTTWQVVAGNVNLREEVPDGDPQVVRLKILPGANVGQTYGIKSTALGSWEGDLGASVGGFGLNRTVAMLISVGANDVPTGGATSDTGQGVPAGTNPNGSIRMVVGSTFSIIIPGDGTAPRFEQRAQAVAANGGVLWNTLYSFAGASPVVANGVATWFVAIVSVGQRVVGYAGPNAGIDAIISSGFCYTGIDPNAPPSNGLLTPQNIQPSPVYISGVTGGGSIWFSIRRGIWSPSGQWSNTLEIDDANTPPSNANMYWQGYTPPVGTAGVSFNLTYPGATQVTYTATVEANSDQRECCAVKWVWFQTSKETTTSAGSYVDYGNAVTEYTLRLPLPDFSGTGGTRGSRGSCMITFDRKGLDIIAAANSTTWQDDIVQYNMAIFVSGYWDQNTDTPVEEERLYGFFQNPAVRTDGFNNQYVTINLLDYWQRLAQPAAFIDSSYIPLSVLDSGELPYLYGWQAIQYLLEKAFDTQTAAALQVYMPTNWLPLTTNAFAALVQDLPSADLPLWTPPYGSYCAEFIRQIASYDFAALFFYKSVPYYGQYNLVIANFPTYDIYDGTLSPEFMEPNPGTIPSNQIGWTIQKMDYRVDSQNDYNAFRVWGSVPGGIGSGQNPQAIGYPLVSAVARDYSRIAPTWERTYLMQGPQFYRPDQAQLLVNQMLAFANQGKDVQHYLATTTIPHPELYWGVSLTFNGFNFVDPELNGETLRIVDLEEQGDMVNKKVTITLQIVPAIAD